MDDWQLKAVTVVRLERLRYNRDGLKGDGTLSRPRICKPLYGPLQGDETGD